MDYSIEDYELANEEVISGEEAQIFRMLDAREPIRNKLGMTDIETLDELVELNPSLRWCPELHVIVAPYGQDMFCEHQDIDHVVSKIAQLCKTRIKWTQNMIARAQGADATYVKMANKFLNYAQSSASSSRVNGVAKLFCRIRTVHQNELNSANKVIGTLNGAYNLTTAHLCTEDGDDARRFNITQCVNADVNGMWGTDFEIDKRWYEFILEIMSGDEEKADYLQRALGYSLIGGNPEECMFIAHGPESRNGKNTLLDSVQHALGTYATTTERGFLLAGTKTSGTDEALASLVGKRMVTISEPPKGRKLDESKVKSLTSCDMQSTSKKYGSQFTFKPQFTLWMSCNNLPEVEDDSVFASDRIRVISFNRHFTKDERDPELKKRFTSERGAYTVFDWILRGYYKYLERGLEEPESIKIATESYTNLGGTPLDRFLRKYCTLKPESRVLSKSFKECFDAYCENIEDVPRYTTQAMNKELKVSGVSNRKSHGKMWLHGIQMIDENMLANFESKSHPDGLQKRQSGSNRAKNNGKIGLR